MNEKNGATLWQKVKFQVFLTGFTPLRLKFDI
jgi:hypothetical protein